MRALRVGLLGVFLGAVAPARASEERFELAQRVRALEIAWQQSDGPARERALKPLQQATNIFLLKVLGGDERLRGVAREFDRARFALAAARPPDSARLWAESLHVTPEGRLLDTTTSELSLTLQSFYEVNANVPAGARLRLTLIDVHGKALSAVHEGAIARTPLRTKLPTKGIPAGDHRLRAEIVVGGRVLAHSLQPLSWVQDLSERLTALRRMTESWREAADDTQRQTVRGLLQSLEQLARKQPLETIYPAAHLLAEAEAAAAAISAGRPYYGQKKPGEFWLSLATEKKVVPSRLMAPAAATRGKPLPLVIVLHGSGGSENLYFDVHGPGLLVRLCRERGWLVVAPQSSFFRAPPVSGVLAEVEKLYPVDRQRILLVGGSIGGMHALNAAQERPGRVAGVAVLAGMGRVTEPAALKNVAIFVGVGRGDQLMLESTRSLWVQLEKADVKRLEYREYAGVEHLTIDVAALADAFRFFDQVVIPPEQSD
jgi:predicted esterase